MLITGFGIPKIISVNDFGVYRSFLLYASYLSFLHFGFIDGAYIRNAGKILDKNTKDSFSEEFTLFVLLQSVIIIVFYFVIKDKNFSILFAFFIYFTALNNYLNFSLKAFKLMNPSINGEILNKLLLALAVVFIFATRTQIEPIHLFIMLILFLAVKLAYYLSKLNFYRPKRLTIQRSKEILKDNIGLGLLILIGNAAFIFTTKLDKVFVENIFSKEQFAIYIFPVSLILINELITTSVSRIILPFLKDEKGPLLIKKLGNEGEYIFFFISLSLVVLVFPVGWLLEHFYKGYLPSILFYKFFLIGYIPLSISKLVHSNLFMAFELKYQYAFSNLLIFVTGFGIYYSLFIYSADTIFYGIAYIFLMLIRYIVHEMVLYKRKIITRVGTKLVFTSTFTIGLTYLFYLFN